MALLLERGYNGTQSGGREDLSNLISNVDAKSTVFTSMAKKGKKPGNALMSWQMDKYESPTNGGYVDGTDVDLSATAQAAAASVRSELRPSAPSLRRRRAVADARAASSSSSKYPRCCWPLSCSMYACQQRCALNQYTPV